MKLIVSNPKAQYLSCKKEIKKAIFKVLESGNYILGDEVRSFEKEFSKYIGLRYGIGVASGTDSLHISLKACSIGVGDEVITVPHTAVATVQAIELSGATPVLVDVEPKFYTINPNKLKKAINKDTKAIIPVHLYGQAADLRPLLKIAKKNNIKVIEDCAQAHGTVLNGKKVGSWGDIGCFSFYPTKNLGGYGDGGMIVTNNKRLANKCQMIRQHGWEKHYISKLKGLNSCLDELMAAVLRIKLKHLNKNNKKRRKIAAFYNKSLNKKDLILPQVRKNSTHTYHQYVVLSKKRDQLKKYLEKNNIYPGIHYPQPIHLQPAYKNRIKISEDLAVSEKLCQQILSLPIFPEIKYSQIKHIIKTVNKFFN